MTRLMTMLAAQIHTQNLTKSEGRIYIAAETSTELTIRARQDKEGNDNERPATS